MLEMHVFLYEYDLNVHYMEIYETLIYLIKWEEIPVEWKENSMDLWKGIDGKKDLARTGDPILI